MPLSTAKSQTGAIDALVTIADLARFLLPDFAVTYGLTNQGMGNFVQQHLLDLIKFAGCQQVL